MKFAEWQEQVPRGIRDDSLWKMQAYRLALFASDLCWHDVTKLMKDKRTQSLADQLFRAVGSIDANLSEGYSRRTGKDRARFYEYSLGSAREARGWYFKARHVLGHEVADHRIRFLVEILRLLLTMVPEQRGTRIAEEAASYGANELDALLEDIPM